MDIISAIADAITRQEGATQNNNPGNIWDGTGPGKPNRIWPQYPIDSRGFVIYPSYADGRAALQNQITIKINRGETLSQLINEWDSGDPPANRATYVANVSTWTGLPTDIPLNSLTGDAPNPTGGDGGNAVAASSFNPLQSIFGDFLTPDDAGTAQASIYQGPSVGVLLGIAAAVVLIWYGFQD